MNADENFEQNARAPFALPLVRLGLRAPYPLLNPAMGMVMRRLRRRHPALFKAIAEMEPASLSVELTDAPRKFRLELGGGRVQIRTMCDGRQPVTVKITGSLEALLDILEARSDGDALFFSRGIRLTGNSAPIVALRNILDSESINLLDEALLLLGPLAPPAHRTWRCAARISRSFAEKRESREDAA